MISCRYCGTELQFVGEMEKEFFFNCTHCVIVFPLAATSVDRKRKMSVPEYLVDIDIYQSTKQLLERDTYTLYHILKATRSFWFDIKKLLESMKVYYKENEVPQAEVGVEDDLKSMKEEFKLLTKQKFVVENILLERTGFFPEKITQEFLNTIDSQGLAASSKPMYIYIK